MPRYGKRADLIVHGDEPVQRRDGLAALAEGPLTATDAFYVRGHGPVPEIDPATWRLHVHGKVERELHLSLATLREAFREREVDRDAAVRGQPARGPDGLPGHPRRGAVGAGATGTATWTGVALADVLALAGPLRDGAHVGFGGADLCSEAMPAQRFGGSIRSTRPAAGRSCSRGA